MKRASARRSGASRPPGKPQVDPRSVRILIDEDLPGNLAEQLRSRGYEASSINEIREQVWGGATRIPDDDVCREVARIPSVLVTYNVRDYADPAFIERLAEEFGVSAVIVRAPRKESGAGKRAAAIRDIVHRHAHRIGSLYDEPEPVVVSANRVGFRRRSLTEILRVRAQR